MAITFQLIKCQVVVYLDSYQTCGPGPGVLQRAPVITKQANLLFAHWLACLQPFGPESESNRLWPHRSRPASLQQYKARARS